jgi:hypothetical protein
VYPYKYYRYINLPKIPQSIVESINLNFDQYEKKDAGNHGDIYKWSDSFNSEVNHWCKANICDDMWWAFQFIRGDLKPHIDVVTKYKFVYLLDTGGTDVITKWYNDDQTEIVDSVVLEPLRWHILKVDTWHSVQGVAPGQTRYSITSRLF